MTNNILTENRFSIPPGMFYYQAQDVLEIYRNTLSVRAFNTHDDEYISRRVRNSMNRVGHEVHRNFETFILNSK